MSIQYNNHVINTEDNDSNQANSASHSTTSSINDSLEKTKFINSVMEIDDAESNLQYELAQLKQEKDADGDKNNATNKRKHVTVESDDDSDDDSEDSMQYKINLQSKDILIQELSQRIEQLEETNKIQKEQFEAKELDNLSNIGDPSMLLKDFYQPSTDEIFDKNYDIPDKCSNGGIINLEAQLLSNQVKIDLLREKAHLALKQINALNEDRCLLNNRLSRYDTAYDKQLNLKQEDKDYIRNENKKT